MAEETAHLEQLNTALLDKEGKYLTFALGPEEYGLEILKVREIIDAEEDETVDLSDGTCRFDDLVSSKPIRSGIHSLDGILLLYGKPIKPGVTIQHASILDITPTLLALAGFPIGEDMDGHVLNEAIRKEFLTSKPISTIPTYDIDIPIRRRQGRTGFQLNEELQQKLKALGYVN